MIKRVGFESSPLDRLQLEFTDAAVRVLERNLLIAVDPTTGAVAQTEADE